MARIRLIGVKLILFAAAVFLALWNWLWREKLALPVLSDLEPLIVYIIAGVILIIEIIINFATRNRY